MFTGLVEDLGSVVEISRREVGALIRIRSDKMASDVSLGDSICVNGCCLTVIEIDGSNLAFEAGTETLQRTNLGQLGEGNSVNVERSLRPHDRMGGHFVTGHIDATGNVEQMVEEGDADNRWVKFWFSFPSTLAGQMASKGSIAVDGISLTLVDVESDRFSVAVIPHTLQVTTLGHRKPGESVNLETDLLAKYVEKQLSLR